MGASTRTYWPSMSDYQEAVQSPQVCFSDKDLKAGSPVLTALGLPRPICGAFASVYELEQGGNRWAVKCFLRNIPDQHKRYAKISSHLNSCGLPYFVTFDYLSEAIMVQGKKFPLVKMAWVEAEALNQYVVANLNNTQALRDLEARWLQLLEDLKSKNIAHGDLQHGNVLVDSSGNLRLIDYDGMWVPALKGQKSHETGHADYQSPKRSENDFDATIDSFAGTVIHIAIRALTHKPDLFKKYDNGENLLFKRQDFVDPNSSAVFAELPSLGDPEIDDMLDRLRAACGGGKATVKMPKPGSKKAKKAAPPPKPAPAAKSPAARPPAPKPSPPPKASPAPKPAPAPAAPAGPSWMQDHIGGPTSAVAATVTPAPKTPPPAAKPPAPPPPAAKPAPVKAPKPPRPGKAPKPARAKPPKPAKAAKPPKAPTPARAARSQTQPSGSSNGSPIGALIFHAIAGAPGAYLALAGGMEMIRWGGAAVTGLGLISMLTLGVFRGGHRMASTLYFGAVGLGVLGNTIFELITTGSFGTTDENMVQYGLRGLLLVTCLIGILMGRRRSP